MRLVLNSLDKVPDDVVASVRAVAPGDLSWSDKDIAIAASCALEIAEALDDGEFHEFLEHGRVSGLLDRLSETSRRLLRSGPMLWAAAWVGARLAEAVVAADSGVRVENEMATSQEPARTVVGRDQRTYRGWCGPKQSRPRPRHWLSQKTPEPG